ncbi:MAG: YceG family protein, partial [Romboutsia timonensis]
MQAQDIVLFDDENINRIFLESLDYIIPLSIKNENFFNENIRNNFITKLIVWTYSFVKNINFNSDFNPKCIYYGQISRHEIYFLIMLHLMDFDVVYINPLKEEFFEEIDTDKLSELKMSMNIEPLETFKDRAAKGNTIDNVETITKQIERDINETLFADTGIYKPWQYRSGYTKRILLDTILEDIYIYWNEPAKLRTGFRVENNVVSVPCFFYKIDGQFINDFEFQRLVKFCTESKNTLFFNDGRISSMNEESDDMYSLMFCQLSDGTFDIEEVKKTSIYRFGKYSNEVQNLILNKFNEIIVKKDIFNINLDKEKILRFFALVLSMDEQIIRIIDNFD